MTAKDLILGTIGQMGTNGAAGHAVEYAGEVIRGFSMEQRMTVCNMTIEGGGRAGMVAPDETTFEWVEGRPGAPEDFEEARRYWRTLPTDDGATFDREITVDAAALSPLVTWGTNPGQVVGVADDGARARLRDRRALARLHGPGGRHADHRAQARPRLHRLLHQRPDRRPARRRGDDQGPSRGLQRDAMVVPGSQQVAAQAEREGLDEVFRAAGFDWRTAGCSMCLGMNPDILDPGQRCASTSNRNFEGRQGRGGRTHLVSPQMAAAAAIEGHFVDIREWN